MKTNLRFFFLVSFLFCLLSSKAQIPQGFSYQAIAKDGSNPIANQSLPVKISVMADSLGSGIIWQEIHSSVTTNASGMFTLILGKGSRQTVSTVAAFGDIDWSVTPKFLRTEINYSGWKTMGVTRFWAVPYSLNTAGVSGTLSKLAVKGNTTLNDEALFEVKNKDSQTVFAVYNEGVRVYVSDGAKGLKGGFAVGGFGTDKAVSTPYFVVGKDSVRVYLDTNPLTKKMKGGFAVGGYDLTKGAVQDYLDVNSDSVRIYIDSNPATKKVKGGFAVGGYDMVKGTNTNYMNVNTDASGVINPSQNRILWYPLKNAFLTGRVLVENKDSVGENSFSSGFESKAKGQYSQALGYKAIARGDYSTAIGKNSAANYINSFAFGENAIAGNSQTYALGKGTLANGLGSFAFGFNAKATGQDAFALGSGTEATAQGSFALGFIGRDSAGMATGNTKATGVWSVAIGMGAQSKNQGAFSLGIQSVADGQFSFAAGYKTTASAYSAAIGYSCTASGGTFAAGFWSKANGAYSTAIGNGALSNGAGSIAIGNYVTSNADYSTALGYVTKATGYGSTSFGFTTTASGSFSIVSGFESTATGDYGSVSFGYRSNATGRGSVALGYGAAAGGWYSSAIGQNTKAIGSNSSAIGYETTAGGGYSTALGDRTVAAGLWSTAMGNSTYAMGSVSTTMGFDTKAYGEGSIAMGWSSRARANYSISAGTSTVSNSYRSIVLGAYNDTTCSLAGKTSWVSTDPLFIVGCGISDGGRINAVTVLKNGYTAIGSASPTQMLDVNGNARFRNIGSGAYLGPVNRTSDGTLTTATSDIRSKEDIHTLENSLNSVLNLRGISFKWKSEPGLGTRIGFIAQEVEKVLPELVFTNPADGLKGVNYAEVTAVLVEAIKEQQQQIEKLEKLVEQLIEGK